MENGSTISLKRIRQTAWRWNWRLRAKKKARWFWRKNRRPGEEVREEMALGSRHRDLCDAAAEAETVPVQAPLLTILTGISLHSAILAQTGLNTELKWPNDILMNGKKLGGILTEMHAEPSQVRFVIVGIGVNVNQEKFPAELSSIATSLSKESGKLHSRLELLVRLLREFESDYNRFLREGPSYVVERFGEVSQFASGKKVHVDTGRETYVGTTAGLTADGLLKVKKEDGQVITVVAGDVKEVR